MQCATLTSAPGEVADHRPIDLWFTPARFLPCLALLVLAAFPEIVFGSKTFFFRDYSLFGYPLASYYRDCFWRGEIPLWNPLNNCGLPFLAQWNTLTLYPLSILYLVFPLSWSLGVFCLGHLFLGGAGMYFLAHRLTGHRFAACLAGLVFAFSGLTMNCLMWPNNIAALGWMPWVVLVMEKAWQDGGRHVLTAGVVAAMQMLTGAPEIIFLTWCCVFALAAGQWVRGDIPRRRLGLRLAVVMLIVAGLTAAQMLPFLDLLAHSQRNRDFGGSLWSMPWWGWANFLVPLFGCAPGSHGVYSQTDQNWIHSYYVGAATVTLAFVAIWRLREWRIWLFAGLAVFCLILSLGEQAILYTWVQKFLPIFGFMRFPIKFVVLPVFLIPLLAAFAVRHYMDNAWLTEREARRNLLLPSGFVLGLIGVILVLGLLHPLPEVSWPTTLRNGLMRILFLGLAVGAMLMLRRADSPGLQRLLCLGLLLLTWLDLTTHAPRTNPTVGRWVYQPGLVNEMLPTNPSPMLGESRAMVSPAAQQELRFSYIPDPEKLIPSRRVSLFCNLNLMESVPKVNGMYSLYLEQEVDLRGLVYATTNAAPAPLLDFMAVSQITAPGKLFDWQARPTHLPLATAGQSPVFLEGPPVVDQVLSPAFQPRQDVYLPPAAKPFLTVTNRSQARVLSQSFSAHQARLEVDAPEPALVTISQAFYHPWRAFVDGKPTRLWRANHAFQALEVPAGRHEVKLIYVDWMFRWGAMISGATFLACLAAWFLWRGMKSDEGAGAGE